MTDGPPRLLACDGRTCLARTVGRLPVLVPLGRPPCGLWPHRVAPARHGCSSQRIPVGRAAFEPPRPRSYLNHPPSAVNPRHIGPACQRYPTPIASHSSTAWQPAAEAVLVHACMCTPPSATNRVHPCRVAAPGRCNTAVQHPPSSHTHTAACTRLLPLRPAPACPLQPEHHAAAVAGTPVNRSPRCALPSPGRSRRLLRGPRRSPSVRPRTSWRSGCRRRYRRETRCVPPPLPPPVPAGRVRAARAPRCRAAGCRAGCTWGARRPASGQAELRRRARSGRCDGWGLVQGLQRCDDRAELRQHASRCAAGRTHRDPHPGHSAPGRVFPVRPGTAPRRSRPACVRRRGRSRFPTLSSPPDPHASLHCDWYLYGPCSAVAGTASSAVLGCLLACLLMRARTEQGPGPSGTRRSSNGSSHSRRSDWLHGMVALTAGSGNCYRLDARAATSIDALRSAARAPRPQVDGSRSGAGSTRRPRAGASAAARIAHVSTEPDRQLTVAGPSAPQAYTSAHVSNTACACACASRCAHAYLLQIVAYTSAHVSTICAAQLLTPTPPPAPPPGAMASPGHGPDTRGPTTLAVGLGRAEPGGAVQKSAFEVASDAFNTFKRLLTQHEVVSEFLQENHAKFFKMYEELLQSKNYATQRQVPPPRPPPTTSTCAVCASRRTFAPPPSTWHGRPVLACIAVVLACIGLCWPVFRLCRAALAVVSGPSPGTSLLRPGAWAARCWPPA